MYSFHSALENLQDSMEYTDADDLTRRSLYQIRLVERTLDETMYQMVPVCNEQYHDDHTHDRMVPSNADRGDCGSADSNAKVLDRASAYVHNTRENALGIFQIPYSQATSENCGNPGRIYHSYTY